MKIKIVTLGCKLNFAESSALMNTLIAKGHSRCKAGEKADVIIVNTCTVTDTADKKDRQAIHRLKREYPDAKIIVTGCYARRMGQGDILKEIDHIIPKDLEHFHHAYSRDDRTRCFL
ncbi:MAG: tRNA (N(6)-L-threonylcarbamoyladenosine(37)-C(2))-methylthiotransferase MtaB, partial [Paludibacteraceae bacterium]|nr:tRNA (N(6)-L-threonylcarbamoyladenosine(37)-C(2))-methylthiotransferase MtaB [Paludibacteraceae bacterium]